MGAGNQFKRPYAYVGDGFDPTGRNVIMTGNSDIPQYQEAISFWNECIASAKYQALEAMKTTATQRERATRNQMAIDQRAVDGALNRGGFIMFDSMPMDWESKLDLWANPYGSGMMGGAMPGMETWIPENYRQDLIQQRIQSLEEQDQVAELNDPTVDEGASEIEQIADAQKTIGGLLRAINAQLVGGLIDKTILTNLSQISDILGEWGYAFGVSYLDNLRTQLLDEPGIADPNMLEMYRARAEGETSVEGQSAVMTAISAFASDIVRDIIDRLTADTYQGMNVEERKQALQAIMSEFRKKTYSQLSPVTIVPRNKIEALQSVLGMVDRLVGEEQKYEILQVIDPEFNPDMIPPDGLDYQQIRPKIVEVLKRDTYEQLLSYYRAWYSLVTGSPLEEAPSIPQAVPEQSLFEPVDEDEPGEIPATVERIVPAASMAEALELPAGEEEESNPREMDEPRRRPTSIEEMMERRRGQEFEPAPRRAPARRRRAVEAPEETGRMAEFVRPTGRRTPPRPASAAETETAEDIEQRLAEETLSDLRSVLELMEESAKRRREGRREARKEGLQPARQ